MIIIIKITILLLVFQYCMESSPKSTEIQAENNVEKDNGRLSAVNLKKKLIDQYQIELETVTIQQVKIEFEQINKIFNDKSFYSKLVTPTLVIQKLNRYFDILPFKQNNVILKMIDIPDEILSKKQTNGYINASYISDLNQNQGIDFIATQAPIAASFDSFWLMVWQENVATIFMLCQGDGNRGCENYWPQINQKQIHGSFGVELISMEKLNEFCLVRKFELTNRFTGVTREIIQYNAVGWPDKSVPIASHTKYMQELIDIAIGLRKQNNSPIIVHCSAGVGRTGTFITLYYIMNNLSLFVANVGKPKEDHSQHHLSPSLIYETVKIQRTLRMKMVQTQQQYFYIYEFIKIALKKISKDFESMQQSQDSDM